MGFTFEASDTGAASSGTTATTGTHSLGSNSGDLIVASIHTNSQGSEIAVGANSTGAAWTRVYNKNGEASNQVSMQWKIANGTEDATYTFAINDDTRWSVAVARFSHTGSSVVVDQTYSENNGGASTTAQTATITASANAVALYIATADRSSSPFWSAQTNDYAEIEPGVGQSQCLCWKVLDSGGSTDSQATLSSDHWGTNIFSFKEDAGGAATSKLVVLNRNRGM